MLPQVDLKKEVTTLNKSNSNTKKMFHKEITFIRVLTFSSSNKDHL
jgi:hypothetical protein